MTIQSELDELLNERRIAYNFFNEVTEEAAIDFAIHRLNFINHRIDQLIHETKQAV